MAESPRCPACNSPLDLSSSACQICLRPVSRREILRALQSGKRVEKRRRRLLYGLFLLVAAAAAVARWPHLRRAVMAPLAKAGDSIASGFKANWPQSGPRPDAPSALPASVPPDAPIASAPAPAPALAPEPDAPASDAPAQAPRPEPAAAPILKVTGLVYFLREAEPAPGVELTFTSTTDRAVRRARADKNGRYKVLLPVTPGDSAPGYRVSIAWRGRAAVYLEEAALPYRERTTAQREDAIEEARQSQVLHAPLTPESNETTQDFALLP